MTRRRFLSSCLSCAAALPLPHARTAEAATTARARACPLLRGPLHWFDPAWSVEQWREELETQRAIGFDLLWLCGLGQVDDSRVGRFTELVRLCERRKVKLLLDCGSTGNWYGELDIRKEIAVIRAQVARLAPAVRSSPVFFGWYVPQEIYYCTGAMHKYVAELYPAAAQICRAATPGSPVCLSPFFILDRTRTFGDFYVPTPDEYADYWARLLAPSMFDIVMLQDSGEHFAWVTDDQRRPYFAAMQRACKKAGAKLWGNVESAEMNYSSIEEYAGVNGKVHHARAREPRWRPVPMPRFVSKMRVAADYCEDFVTWGYREFCRPSLGQAARQWYDDYGRYRSGCLSRAPKGTG